MSVWSFGAQPSQLTPTTFRDAKVWVARVVGELGDPDKVGAGDAISAAIDELNRRRWEFLTVRGSDITLVGGTSDYDLPTPFKDPLSLIIVAPEKRALTYVPRGTWDSLIGGNEVGGTWFYTNFAMGLTNKVQLLDTPASGGTMEIRYYRPIATPTSDTDTLDVRSGPMELALLARAQTWVAIWRGLHSERLALMERRSHELLNKAYGDETPIDWTPQLVPARVWMRPTTSANSVPNWWDW